MIPILPVSGVPDELIRVLNARLRELETAIPTPATDPAVAPAASSRYTRVTSRETGVGAVVESALTDDGTDITAAGRNVVATGMRPQFRAVATGTTTPARIGQFRSTDSAVWTLNLSYDGANWNRDDIAAIGVLVRLLSTGGFQVLTAAAGANPVAAFITALAVDVAGNVNTPAVYKVAGTQVVAAQQADPGVVAAAPAVSTSLTAQTADATYSANEQQMLNELKTSLGNVNTSLTSLETQVNNLRTDRDRLRAVLQAHGLMA